MATAFRPAWLVCALSYIGLREIVGPKHNPTIIAKLKAMGSKILGIAVTDDETAWCGSFMAWVMLECGIQPPRIAVRASSWDAFGVACQPIVGAVGRFSRSGGGHVGQLTGRAMRRVKGKAQPVLCYRVLGGNQSNMVCETWLEADRLVATRWPAGRPIVATPLPWLTDDGKPVSTNEA